MHEIFYVLYWPAGITVTMTDFIIILELPQYSTKFKVKMSISTDES